MVVKEYAKSGKIANKKSIKPTQEMQELLDILWSSARTTAEISTAYINKKIS